MRENFEVLVEAFFKDDKLAQEKLNALFFQSLFEYSFNFIEYFRLRSIKLRDDEIICLEQWANTTSNNLAANYIKGCLCRLKKEYEDAILFFEKCISQNYIMAMSNRASMHYKGLGGGEENLSLMNDTVISEDSVGATYFYASRARGIVSYSKAILLYEQAIQQGGDLRAMHERAIMYKNGHGGSVNYLEAAKLLRQSSWMIPDSLDELQKLRKHTFIYFFYFSWEERQVIRYHCAVVEKKLSFFLKKYPENINFFLNDSLLSDDEKEVVLSSLRGECIPKNSTQLFDNAELPLQESIILTKDVCSKEFSSDLARLSKASKHRRSKNCFFQEKNSSSDTELTPLVPNELTKKYYG